MGEASDELWHFAVEIYGREGVAALCLRLQDEHGVDVDLVLAALWQVTRGGSLGAAQVSHLREVAARARAEVQRARATRRSLGLAREADPAWTDAYEHAKATELAAERVELRWLEAALREAPLEAAEGSAEREVRARDALDHVLRAEGAGPRAQPLARSLIAAAFPR